MIRNLVELYPGFLIFYAEHYVFHYESYGLLICDILVYISHLPALLLSFRAIPLSWDINLKDMTMFTFCYNSGYL